MQILGIQALTPEWFARRREGLTATDLVKVMGVSTFGTALDVWADKTGKLEPEERADAPYLEWGRRTEDTHRAWVSDLQGVAISASPGLVQDAEFPWLLATPDGLLGPRGIAENIRFFDDPVDWSGVWEGKALNPFGRSDWQEGVPLAVQVQVMAQLRVCGLDQAIASNFAWPEPVAIELERNDVFVEEMVAAAEEFWTRNVQKDIPPEVSGDDIATLRRLFPNIHAKIHELGREAAPAVDALTVVEDRLREMRAQVRDLEKVRADHQAVILQEMGEAEFAVFGDITFKRGVVNKKPQAETTYQTFRRVKEVS